MTLPLEPFPHRISRDVPITPIDKRETAVYAFDKDSPAGDITWETEQPATEQINQAIRNVLVRKPARFFDVTVQQAEKEDKEAEKKRVEEEQDSSLLKTQDLSESEGTAKTAQEAVEVAVKMMTVEEMGQMKVELHQTLGVAWNELNKIAELCRSLITTQPHPYVLPPNEATASIPAKSLSGTLADRAPPTQAVRLLGDTKLAVVQHIDSIKRSQDILVDGSKQLMSLREQEDVYWRNVLRVRGIGGGNGQDDSQGPGDKKKVAETGDSLSWSLLPRPLSNGLPPHRQMATDVMIPYAPDEATPGFRALAMATMNAPSTTPTSADQAGQQEEEILFRARRHKRLRVCIRSTDAGDSYSRVTGLADPAAHGTISSELSRAQAEMFDDEVFETLRSEAKNTTTLNTRSSTDQISVDAVPGQEVVFEMVDTEDVYQEQMNSSVKVSTHANLLAALLRLGMLKIYRTRSQNPSSALGAQPSQKELLTPIIAYLHYQAFCRQLYEILGGFQQTMKRAGMSLEVSKNTGGVTGGLDWEAFLGDDASLTADGQRQSNLKGNVEVLFEQRPFCTILVTVDAHLTIIFSQTMFHSQDIAQLPVFLGQQLRSQVLSLLVDNLKAVPEPVRYHVDEIAGVIKTRPTKVDIGFTLDNPPHLVAQSSRILPVGEGSETAFIVSDERIVKERYTDATGVPFVAWAMERLL